MIGMPPVVGSARMRRTSSMPSVQGIRASTTARSGRASNRARPASSPSSASTTWASSSISRMSFSAARIAQSSSTTRMIGLLSIVHPALPAYRVRPASGGPNAYIRQDPVARSSEDPLAQRRQGQADRELGGGVGAVAYRVDLDQLETAQTTGLGD